MKKLRQFSGLLCVAGLLAAQPGCMTIDHLLDPQQPLSMYGGTTSSYEEMEDVKTGWFAVLCRLLDLPLTMALDTALLPVTAPIQLTR